MPPKTVRESRITLSELMEPIHANLWGNVHGGVIMKLVDQAGALACMKHAQTNVVTVAMDQLTFKEPIQIGDLVTLTAELTYTGRSSMEARVEVTAENPIKGVKSHTNTAYLVYVALDGERKPVPVPPLVAENDFERERMERAKQRQEYRQQQRLVEKAIPKG